MIYSLTVICDYGDCHNDAEAPSLEVLKDMGWKATNKEHICPDCVVSLEVEKEYERSKQYGKSRYRAKIAPTFQKMIRLKYAAMHKPVTCFNGRDVVEKDSPPGMLTCVTCGLRDQYDSGRFDAGHYMSRSKSLTIFLEANCHVQCKKCNSKFGGSADSQYQIWMESEFGREFASDVRALSNKMLADYDTKAFPPEEFLLEGEVRKLAQEDWRYYYAKLIVNWKRRIKLYEGKIKHVKGGLS